MKEQILTILYSVLKPWACEASDTIAFVHPANYEIARQVLNKNGFDFIHIKPLTLWPEK